jgi:hypothetical protein
MVARPASTRRRVGVDGGTAPLWSPVINDVTHGAPVKDGEDNPTKIVQSLS